MLTDFRMLAGSIRDPGIAILLVIALFGGVWRITGLERESMNMDEIRQAEIARGSMSYEPATSLASPYSWALLVGRAAKQQQPPLDYLLQRFANQFSPRDCAQRAVSCAFGTIAIFLTGLLGVRLGGFRVGVVAALLLCVSPLHIELSRTARPYAIAQVLWLITVLIAYWAYQTNTRRAWIIFAVTAFAFLITRGDLPLFALSALGLVFLAVRCWRGAVALLVPGTLYLPLLVIILHVSGHYLGQTPSSNAHMFMQSIGELAGPLPYILLPLALVGGWAVRRRPLALWFFALCGLTVVLHLGFWFARVAWPLFPRYLMYYSTPLTILASFGFWSSACFASRLRYLCPVGSAILFTVFVTLAFQREQLPSKEGWRNAALLATQRGIDHIWMFRTGDLREWIPEFYGAWYRPIAYSKPVPPGLGVARGKLAAIVWEDDSYDASREPLLDVDTLEHVRFYRLHMFLPRPTCGSRCTLESVLTVLSRQPGYLELRREVMRSDASNTLP